MVVDIALFSAQVKGGKDVDFGEGSESLVKIYTKVFASASSPR